MTITLKPRKVVGTKIDNLKKTGEGHPLCSKTIASKKLLEGLNKTIAMDLWATIQHMWQHVMVLWVEGVAVSNVFKGIAMQEIKRTESFADRLYYLGGIPQGVA